MPLVNLTTPEAIGDADQCVVVTWLKREGDEIEIGDTILELQAAKVSFDVPSPLKGRLVKILAKQGDVVDWGQVLAQLEASETDTRGTAVAERDRPATASPVAVRIAADKGIDLSSIKGSGPNGRIIEKDVYKTIAEMEKPAPLDVPVSPAAKRLAREHKIDISKVKGSGAGGRISEVDVMAFIDKQAERPASGISPNPSIQSESQEYSITGIRAVIAQRMLESMQTTAQLTLHTQADMSEIVARHSIDKQRAPITYTDYVIKACAQALRQHPAINAHIDGATIRVFAQVNIGLAVSLQDGLIVPVIFNADQLTLEAIAHERIRMAERARAGKLNPPEYSGGTFTITNLGAFDIDAFTPILNPPELAILGIGRIDEKVVIHHGKIAQRHMMTLSLTIDHRIIDGAPGAAFLKTIKQLLESVVGFDGI